jgi:hypothetical protein
MKVEIDLNDILGGEEGCETLQEAVRRQIIQKMTSEIQNKIGKRVDEEIQREVDTQIKEAIKSQMPTLINDLMFAEYTPVDRYGSYNRNAKTTFRDQLVKGITEDLVYSKKNYDSDKNTFTKAVDEIVRSNVDEFKKGFDKMVNETFTKDCFEYAQKKMAEKLGILTK